MYNRTMKIAFFELEKSDQEILSKSFPGSEVTFFEEKLDETNTDKAKDVEIVCVFVSSQINKNVLKIAKGLAMNVVAYDLFPDLSFAKENNFEYRTLDEVIAAADVITLHAPYTKENHHLINKEKIMLMKRGVHLINTARGELVDTDALIWGLKGGIIAGAGLDVLEGERELKDEIEILSSAARSLKVDEYKTLLEDRILIDMPNVIIPPHFAFYPREAVAEILKVTADNIKGFMEGKPVNLVK